MARLDMNGDVLVVTLSRTRTARRSQPSRTRLGCSCPVLFLSLRHPLCRPVSVPGGSGREWSASRGAVVAGLADRPRGFASHAQL
jgi:hypothetical protein